MVTPVKMVNDSVIVVARLRNLFCTFAIEIKQAER